MGRAEEVEALCGQLEPGSSYAVLDAAIAALREYATLLRAEDALRGEGMADAEPPVRESAVEDQ